MSYKILMVHLELGRSNTALLKVAGDLAEQCAAKVIGVAARQPVLAISAAAGYISGEMVELDRAEAEREAREAETEFRDILTHRAVSLDWRCASVFTPLADYISQEARSADLILTTPDRGGSLLAEPRRVKIGDLVMHSGRPVLLVPETATHLPLDRVLLAWKDSREARRAALDALPLLKMAGHVTVAEVVRETDTADAADARQRLQDVIGWLAGHDIEAEPLVQISDTFDARGLAEVAHTVRADVVVAGAYAHNRFREWVFGGVTMDLLINPSRLTFLSH